MSSGGFHDINTLRTEFPETYHINDVDAQKIVDEQMAQRANLTAENKMLLDGYKGLKEEYIDNDLQNYVRKNREYTEQAKEDARYAQNIANEEAQRTRIKQEQEQRSQRRPIYTFDDPFNFNRLKIYNRDNNYDLMTYLAKERLKRELKEEMEEARRKATLQREINAIRNGVSRSNTRSKSKSKARTNSKSKAKAVPKAKSKATPKSKAAPKPKPNPKATPKPTPKATPKPTPKATPKANSSKNKLFK